MSVLARAIRAHVAFNHSTFAIESTATSSIGWAELDERLRVLSRDFSDRFEPARPVAIEIDQGIDACLADLALIEAGVPAMQLPAFFTTAQREHAMAAAGVQALITHDASIPSQVGGLAISSCDHAAVELPTGTAKISFTSGSTGTPKGICLAREHLLGVADAVVDYVGRGHAGRHIALLPPGILLENVAGFYATLLAGGTYIALPQVEVGLANPFRPDLAAVLRTIADHRITSLILVPELLAGLVTAMEMTGIRFPAITLVAVGGARLAPALIERARAVGLPVRQGYGLTECASVVALEDGTESISGSVGLSIGLNRIRLADDGEILIDGPVYLGTIGSPRPPGTLHTGDIGRIGNDGRLTIAGRKSNLVVTAHGRNISPEWVEGLLLGQAAIAQAMVYGEGQPSLGALIVPASAGADVDGAVESANAQLPAYAHIAHWRSVPPFTPANGLLTGNGRMRRQAIAATHLDGDMTMSFFARLVSETANDQAALATVPQLQAGLAGRIDLKTYLAYLTQAYHHVRHTVPLMTDAQLRLAHRPAFVAALDEYIAEETGHEAWILADIDAAGGNSAEAAASTPAPATAAMVEHAYETIRNGNAAAFFGMVYVLEGTSVAMATSGAAAVRETLGLPDAAFTYLTSHGALDVEHMRFFADLMNRIDDPADQQAIITMARDMFRLFADMFAAIPLETLDEAA